MFMGTPGFAAEILSALLNSAIADVVAVYTQPDRTSGRGRRVHFSEVKQLAVAKSLPVYQPLNFKNSADVDSFASLNPDVCVVAAYGLILPQAVLDAPSMGCVNVHASLLPKYRGAAPIQRAIMNGEHVTGVTIMQMDAGMDTGDMLLQRSLGVGIDDTAATIHDELATLGGRLLIEALEMLQANTITAIPQNEALATYAPKLSKKDGEIDWAQPARIIHNHIRGVYPWPGAYFTTARPDTAEPLKLTICPGHISEQTTNEQEPGTILGIHGDCLAIATADKAYLVPQVCPACRPVMDARSFYNGYVCKLSL